jgi:para-aminobenzoate synthetase/4-amino-4-deoxychorismate lyase
MTSGVRARLGGGVGLRQLLDAIFPPGSVTGAPKIRAMELIGRYETEPRGVYCGAIGHISPKGDALFNVAIRTPVVFRDGSGEMGIGSGVVYDSVGSKEYDECLLKLKFLTDPPKPLELIETMLHEPSKGIWLLDRHMRRLAASAHYFRFAFDRTEIETALHDALAGRGSERLRVRLLLDEKGGIKITLAPQPAQTTDARMRFVVSPTRLSSADPFLYHKTTRRELYDREWQHFNKTRGADEVIYLNERGEVAEGSRTSIFVERDGRLLTPPLAAGLLPGTLRAELIAAGRAVEATLVPADILPGGDGRAPVVWLGNSVRGLVRAELLPDAEGTTKVRG